jgi:hypothetical protein
MTTLAVPRSLRTSATSICHALVDAKMDHRATSLKIQGYFSGSFCGRPRFRSVHDRQAWPRWLLASRPSRT